MLTLFKATPLLLLRPRWANACAYQTCARESNPRRGVRADRSNHTTSRVIEDGSHLVSVKHDVGTQPRLGKSARPENQRRAANQGVKRVMAS